MTPRSSRAALARRAPFLAAAASALAGLLNVASALTPTTHGRSAALGHVIPASGEMVAHSLALPAGVALLIVSAALARRRHGALLASVALLGLLTVLNLVKGLDVEEAAVSLALAIALWRGRASFPVATPRIGASLPLVAAIAALATLAASVGVALAAASHAIEPAIAPREVPATAARLLTSLAPGITFTGRWGFLPDALGALGVASLAAALSFALRPLAALRRRASSSELALASRLVRAHGTDSLAAFKLRPDVLHRFGADDRAVACYRVEAGALLMAGDPVGAPEAVAAVLGDLRRDARDAGLAFGVIGASDAFTEMAKAAGMRSLYLGDEALIDPSAFTLEGRAVRKVRQSVARVRRAGYAIEVHAAGDLDAVQLAELEAVSACWRDGAPERGFAMALGELAVEQLPDALVVLARNGDGRIGGFLHLLPVFDRQAVSLAAMRRRRDTPNGLTEFLVVAAIEELRERGIEELSLNFAVLARWLREPACLRERVLGRVLRLFDRFFQIERLLRFNAKFSPRWQARHLLLDSWASLPKVVAGALIAEGQIPAPPPLPALLARGGEPVALAGSRF